MMGAATGPTEPFTVSTYCKRKWTSGAWDTHHLKNIPFDIFICDLDDGMDLHHHQGHRQLQTWVIYDKLQGRAVTETDFSSLEKKC